MMKKLAVIPARYASTRFPGKPLADILGKTMVQWVYEGTLATGLFDKVVVATDDERIRSAVSGFDGHVMMTSPDHMNGTSRTAEVSKAFPEYDLVVNVQGDEPLVAAESLSGILQLLETGTGIASACRQIRNPEESRLASVVKVVMDVEGNALYFSRSLIPYDRDDVNPVYYAHVGIYGFQRDILHKIIALSPGNLERIENLEQLRWLEHGYRIQLCEVNEQAPSIDTPEDLKNLISKLNNETR